jgi:tight adherence protein C
VSGLALPLGAAAGLLLLVLGLALDAREQRRRLLQARLARVCGRDAAEPGRGALREALSALRARLEPAVEAVSATLFIRAVDRVKTRALLRGAGFESDRAVGLFAAAKAAAAAAGLGLGWLLGRELEGALFVAALGAGLALGALAPEQVVSRLRARRLESIRLALPDAIDLMVISANAGQSLDMALQRVAKEMSAFAPEMARELSVVAAEMQVLPERAEALRNFERRADMREARAFALTLTQTIRYGAPFSASLKALAADLRQARVLRAEERGAKLPALLTLPLILFIMPAVFVVVVGPSILSFASIFAGGTP